MSGRERIKLQPAWVLHRRDFRDTSQIIEVFSRDYGRLALVARGVKRPRSRQRGVLQPFACLSLSWIGGSDLATLSDAEPMATPFTLDGEALMCGFYVNELMLKLSHRHDPNPEIFAIYAQCIESLATGANLAAILREFEWRFLAESGFGLDFETDAASGERLTPEGRYHVVVDAGPMAADDAPAGVTYSGATLLAIARNDWSLAETLVAARRILGAAIDRQLDGRTLHTRRIVREMRQRYEAGEQQTK